MKVAKRTVVQYVHETIRIMKLPGANKYGATYYSPSSYSYSDNHKMEIYNEME